MYDQIGEYLVYLIVLLFLIYLLALSQITAFVVFVGVALLGQFCCVPKYTSKSIVLALAFVVTFLFHWFTKQSITESFTQEDEDENKSTPKRTKNKMKKATISRKQEPEEDDDDEEEAGEIDMSKTFLEAYQNLNTEQIGSMTSETQKLIETQKQLMQTLQNLSPIVKQGKELMDGFKGHFGGDKEFVKAMKSYLPFVTKKT